MQSPIAQASGTDAQRNKVAQILNDARGDYRAGKRTETVENTNQYAEDRFNTANSAQNAGNTYRQKLVALLNPKSREGKWYNPEEKADIRAVTAGKQPPIYCAPLATPRAALPGKRRAAAGWPPHWRRVI